MRYHAQACAEASGAALAARDAAAARDADVARLTAQLAATKADLAAHRARVAELTAAVRAAAGSVLRRAPQALCAVRCAPLADPSAPLLFAQLEREKAVAAAASGELEARLAARALLRPRPWRHHHAAPRSLFLPPCLCCAAQDKEEAESRLARLQVEHLDLTQRFMEYKAGESARVRPPLAFLICPTPCLRIPCTLRAACAF